MALGQKISRTFSSLGRKAEKGIEGLGRKVSAVEKKAIRGVGSAVRAVERGEEVLDTGLRGASRVLSGGRQALRVGSQIAGAIPGGRGISMGLEMGARGLDEANMLAKQLRRADLSGVAGSAAARGLERYGERKKMIAKAARESASNVRQGFM